MVVRRIGAKVGSNDLFWEYGGIDSQFLHVKGFTDEGEVQGRWVDEEQNKHLADLPESMKVAQMVQLMLA